MDITCGSTNEHKTAGGGGGSKKKHYDTDKKVNIIHYNGNKDYKTCI